MDPEDKRAYLTKLEEDLMDHKDRMVQDAADSLPRTLIRRIQQGRDLFRRGSSVLAMLCERDPVEVSFGGEGSHVVTIEMVTDAISEVNRTLADVEDPPDWKSPKRLRQVIEKMDVLSAEQLLIRARVTDQFGIPASSLSRWKNEGLIEVIEEVGEQQKIVVGSLREYLKKRLEESENTE